MPKGKGIESKNELRDLMKIKSFCTAKETIIKTERLPMKWEKICANDRSDKGLVSKIYKELTKRNTPKNKKSSEEMGRRHE